MMRPQDGAATLDCGEDAVSRAAGLYCCYEVADRFIPDIAVRGGVGFVVGENLHVMFLQGNEEQNALARRSATMRVLHREFSMC